VEKYCAAAQATADMNANCRLDTKDADMHSEYTKKYCFSTATNVARTRLNYVIRTLLVSFTLSSTFFPNDNTQMSVNP